MFCMARLMYWQDKKDIKPRTVRGVRQTKFEKKKNVCFDLIENYLFMFLFHFSMICKFLVAMQHNSQIFTNNFAAFIRLSLFSA